MSDSLRDQLLKSGLAKEQDLKKVRSNKQKKRRAGKRPPGPAPESEAAREAARSEAAKRERDRELNRTRHAEREREAREKAAREMVIAREIPHGRDSDTAFNFTHQGRIKKINVSPEQRKQLADGRIAIARTRGRFRLVPREVADRVAPDAPFLIAWVNDGPEDSDPAYEEHPIPDDLMW